MVDRVCKPRPTFDNQPTPRTHEGPWVEPLTPSPTPDAPPPPALTSPCVSGDLTPPSRQLSRSAKGPPEIKRAGDLMLLVPPASGACVALDASELARLSE